MSRYDDDDARTHDSMSNTVNDDDVMNDEKFADVRAALGLAVPPVAPSPSMKDAVMAAVATTPQVGPVAAVVPLDESPAAAMVADTHGTAASAEARAQARWFSRPTSLVVAAAAAVALFFGGVAAAGVVNPNAPSAADQLASIVAAPDVSTIVSPVAGGGTSTLVSSESAGLSAMVFEGLPELSDDERYALWYITDGVAAPAGLFAVSGDGAVVQVLDGIFEAGTVVGVTVEPESGSPAPTSDPIVAIATA